MILSRRKANVCPSVQRRICTVKMRSNFQTWVEIGALTVPPFVRFCTYLIPANWRDGRLSIAYENNVIFLLHVCFLRYVLFLQHAAYGRSSFILKKNKKHISINAGYFSVILISAQIH